MSIIGGLADEAAADFAEDFENGVLIVPGTREPDSQGGWKNTDPVSHLCKVLLTNYSDFRRLALGIPAGDRLVLVLGATLPAGVIPAMGNKVTAPDPARRLSPRTFDVIGVSGDPAAALYKLQAR